MKKFVRRGAVGMAAATTFFLTTILGGAALTACSHSSDSSDDGNSVVAPEDGNNTSSSTDDSGNNNNSGNSGSGSNQVTPGGTTATAVMDTPTVANVSNVNVNIVKSEGWLNSAYIVFEQVDGATYKVLCDDVELDAPLIRYYDTYTYYEQSEDENLQVTWTKKTLSKVVRADAFGLAAGEHTMKVCAVGTENNSDYSTATMKVVDHNRSGFAFTGSTNPGAYKADGTLKDGAIVLYVTGSTAKTVSYTQVKGTNASANATYTGLQNILSESSLKKLTVPLDIRIIGTITKDQMDSLGSSAEGLQIKTTSESGITIEGVGHDAAVYGFGFLIRNAKYVELSNLGVYNFMDDGISVDTDNSYLWIHNNDISYGAVGSDSDQAKGDGSLDFKKSTYSTLSYNHFWDSGKCNLLDASAGSDGSNYLSYHHNWYDHSDSRHPRIRNASAVHVYNNYYDGNAKYGVGVTSGSSAFVEGNFFRNANDPMMSSLQGTDAQGSGTFSGEDGGVIKAYNNFYTGNSNYASEGGSTSSGGMKLHYITNKYDYTNGVAVSEPETHTESLGTDNGDGTYTIYSWTYGDSLPSFITKSDATDKTGYYQIGKGKTGFKLSVPANASKVIVTAKSATTGVDSATLKIGGVSQTVNTDNYPEYEFDVSALSSTSLDVVAGSEGSINIKSIKVIAPTAWATTYTTGISLSDIDAYEVDSRSTQVPETVVTKVGGTMYSNFDVALGDSGMGVSIAVTDPVQAKNDVILYCGRHNPDFAYTFTNSTDDSDYGVNTALKTLVVDYTSGLTATQGTSASSSSSSSSESTGSTTTDGDGDSGNTETTVELLAVAAGTYNMTVAGGYTKQDANAATQVVNNIAVSAKVETADVVLKISSSAQQGTVKFKIDSSMTLVVTESTSNGIAIASSDGTATVDGTPVSLSELPTSKNADATISGKTMVLTAGTYELGGCTSSGSKLTQLVFTAN
ncbi:MAG: hypothetical protein IJ673_09210 [Treponema sp.]|nr:hypothetical protein [Treponema sp.]